MPTYDFWAAKYDPDWLETGNTNFYPLTMIFLIWLFYLIFIFVLVLMALNFLIAIFSTSYDEILNRQYEAILESIIELNMDCLQELVVDDEKVK